MYLRRIPKGNNGIFFLLPTREQSPFLVNWLVVKNTYDEIVKGYIDLGSIKDLAILIIEAHKLESETVLVEKSVGYGIVNACVNLGLLEKAHGVPDEMNAQCAFVGLGVYVSILKAYGKEHRTTEVVHS
ncbi:hypothetical protein Tco_1250443 [Tanacetum coccineum]